MLVDLFLSLALLCVGFYIIIRGGDLLVRSALNLSQLSGISTVVVGATFVSLATTLPEIIISVYAILTRNQAIAVGNAIGGMIVSFAVIFALYAVIHPKSVSKQQLVLKSLFLFASLFLVILFSLDGRITLFGGFILGLVYFLYLAITTKKSQKTPVLKKSIEGVQMKTVLREFLFGQMLLLFGAFLLVHNSERLALDLGISETIVGFTLVAMGTSMPELVTVLSSVKRNSSDLAIGSIIGSNIINATLLLGICGVVGALHGSPLVISPTTLFIAIPVLIIASLISILPILIKGRTYRLQGISLLVLYGIYLLALFLI